MLSFSDCHGTIEEYIKKLGLDQKEPGELYEPIAYILGLGGKRIRPVLSLMACNLFTDDVSASVKPAIAMEVFHNFTLVHDDIMDNAPLRRNKPTVHSRWGSNVAILSGDAMQILAYQLMCEGPPRLLKPLLDLFNRTALEVCEGQQFDMNFGSRTDVTIDEYLQMIELKTSVLVAASLQTGAICGGAAETDAQKLYEFGRNLGLAFQIQDDYLDVYGNQELFGKTVGGDIAENKKTFLLLKALELAKGDAANTLKMALCNQITDNSEKIKAVKSVYDQLNIAAIAKEKITEFSQKAFDCLASVDTEVLRKNNLLELAQELMSREK